MEPNIPIPAPPQASAKPDIHETIPEPMQAPVEPVASIGGLAVEYVGIDEITPYPGNPRKNEEAVEKVAASIREFGFKVPIVIDGEGVIVAGHTRYKAARKLGLDKLPCIRATDLTPDQIKAFRLADNKTSELSGWDRELLEKELADLEASGLDMGLFGFLDGMSDEEIDGFFDGVEPPPKEPKKQTVTCPKCGETFEVVIE